MIIYKITNIKNNKIYIGLTTTKSAQCRFNKHISEAFNTTENRYFLNAIRKHGKDNFKVEQIDFAYTIEELKQKEINYIKLLKSTDRNIGYNLSLGGDGTPGILKSEETRNKIRNKAIGRIWSKERREKHSLIFKNSNIDFTKAKQNCLKHNLETSKTVEKYDLNYNLISSYNSISEISKYENINRSTIIRYLKTNKFKNKIPCKGFLYKVK